MFADCAQAQSLTRASSATHRPRTAGPEADRRRARVGKCGTIPPPRICDAAGVAVKSIIIVPELVQIFVFEGCS
jgi:hypothetical protein